MTRDMSKREFAAACRRRGFKPLFFGYYALGETPVQVCAANAGRRRRDQLAYLIREQARAEAACEAQARRAER